MFTQLQMIITGIVLIAVLLGGWFIKSLYDDNMECKLNTKKLKADYKRDKENYDRDVKTIVSFYDGKLDDVKNFKRRTDETDCQASTRFFDSRSYN